MLNVVQPDAAGRQNVGWRAQKARNQPQQDQAKKLLRSLTSSWRARSRAMPAAAFMLANLLNLPPLEAGVIVPFTAMPTGANAYIFAAQYQQLVYPVSSAVALGTLGTLLAAVTLPVVVIVAGVR